MSETPSDQESSLVLSSPLLPVPVIKREIRQLPLLSDEKGPICGNGLLESPERCDDRNTIPGDGCSATCEAESVFETSLTGIGVGSGFDSGGRTPDAIDCDLTVTGGGTFNVGSIAVVTGETNCPTPSSEREYESYSSQIGGGGGSSHDSRSDSGSNSNTGGDSSDDDSGHSGGSGSGGGGGGGGDSSHKDRDDNGDKKKRSIEFSVSGDAVSIVSTEDKSIALLCVKAGSASVTGSVGTRSRSVSISCVSAGCGNAVVDLGEECDDGNTQPGDGCDENCKVETSKCGNGKVESGEECDDSNVDSGDGCDSQCKEEFVTCAVDDPCLPVQACNARGGASAGKCEKDKICCHVTPECAKDTDCDDETICTDDTCVNGQCKHQNNTVSCDDGKACTAEDACKDGLCSGQQKQCPGGQVCSEPEGGKCKCPDDKPYFCDLTGKCESSETECRAGCKTNSDCDDDNLCTTDTCKKGQCRHRNNKVSCDDGKVCTENDRCGGGKCRSGKLKKCTGGRVCSEDDGGQCKCSNDLYFCEPAGRCVADKSLCCGQDSDCDDGNLCTTDTCKKGQCRHRNNKVSCDDGKACTQGDRCRNGACRSGTPKKCLKDQVCAEPEGQCKAKPVCGNKILEADEECDDGNKRNGDGCNSNCKLESCPNVCCSTVSQNPGCAVEKNSKGRCGLPNEVCCLECADAVCGNGAKEGSEECDDGNTTDGDGCNGQCQDEGPYQCQPPYNFCTSKPAGDACASYEIDCAPGSHRECQGTCGAPCPGKCCDCIKDVSVCGNGAKEGSEECDDGNTTDGDGCSSKCKEEKKDECKQCYFDPCINWSGPVACSAAVKKVDCDDPNCNSPKQCCGGGGGKDEDNKDACSVCGTKVCEPGKVCYAIYRKNQDPYAACYPPNHHIGNDGVSCGDGGGSTCGNSKIDKGEECDEGPKGGDVCTQGCTIDWEKIKITEEAPEAVTLTSNNGCSYQCNRIKQVKKYGNVTRFISESFAPMAPFNLSGDYKSEKTVDSVNISCNCKTERPYGANADDAGEDVICGDNGVPAVC